MSASTAAIAASPAVNNGSLELNSDPKPNARRRSVVQVEKRLTEEMHTERGANAVIGDKLTANGKDLSHAIRGDAVPERSKELSQLRKEFIASATISPRRRKPVKPEKPKWQIALSILTKNTLLLAVVLWIGQTIWSWADRIGDKTSSPFIALEYEDRISEVEASLKRTVKMLQVQLEVVDKKIGSELGVMATDLTNKFEENAILFEKELKNLKSRTDHLGKSLGELKDMELLSKEEFGSFWNELKNSGSLDGSDKNAILDKIWALARDIVEKEIEKHAADGLGRVDYALASGGARVVRHSEPYIFGKANNWFAGAKTRNGVHANAHKMLEPSFGEPGWCFPLKGSTGFVEIRLRTGILVEAVTLEHVSKSVAYDRTSAPKDCQVSAWFEGASDDDDNPSTGAADKMLLLAEFSYDLEKSNAQTFNVDTASGAVINTVRFAFASNHGSSALTCIYRLRVHGYEPNAAAAEAMAMKS